MSIKFGKSKRLIPIYRYTTVDSADIICVTPIVERRSFHDKREFVHLQLRVPAGAQITGIILYDIPSLGTNPCNNPECSALCTKPNSANSPGLWHDTDDLAVKRILEAQA